MTSDEIRKKIAELKIRLAFQLEFEEELEKTLAECEETDSASEKQIKDSQSGILRVIEAETRRRRYAQSRRRGRGRAWKVIAIAAVLLTVSFGSALAAICMVESGGLKFDIKVQEKGTVFKLIQTGVRVDAPEGWKGRYFPSYIPKGYEVKYISGSNIQYINENCYEVGFEENDYGDSRVIDTENAVINNVKLNEVEAMIVEKDGWITVIWSANGKYFVVETNDRKEVALQVAASVSLIE